MNLSLLVDSLRAWIRLTPLDGQALLEPTGVYWLVSVTIDQYVDTAAPTTLSTRSSGHVRITVRLGGR